MMGLLEKLLVLLKVFNNGGRNIGRDLRTASIRRFHQRLPVQSRKHFRHQSRVKVLRHLIHFRHLQDHEKEETWVKQAGTRSDMRRGRDSFTTATCKTLTPYPYRQFQRGKSFHRVVHHLGHQHVVREQLHFSKIIKGVIKRPVKTLEINRIWRQVAVFTIRLRVWICRQ